jgi:hypothetical protein
MYRCLTGPPQTPPDDSEVVVTRTGLGSSPLPSNGYGCQVVQADIVTNRHAAVMRTGNGVHM